MMGQQILHLDLDAFFCSVEERDQPHLRGKAFAVGEQPQNRGVVAACSYPARIFGVRSAMSMYRALTLCPTLLVVDKHMEKYQAASKQVMAILRQLTPRVEQVSIDEAFLDVSELGEDGEVQAYTLQAKINYELGLPCSLGVASNKLLAKIANTVGKSREKSGKPPNRVTLVPEGEEAAFLAPLPVRELWGVGQKMEEKLALLNIHTIGDLAAYSPSELERLFGKHGWLISLFARGIDERPFMPEQETKSISREVTFVRDETEQAKLDAILYDLLWSAIDSLRGFGFLAKTVKLKLRWSDFTTISRQAPLPYPTYEERLIYEVARQLMRECRPDSRPVRLIGVGLSNLSHNMDWYHQLPLWPL